MIGRIARSGWQWTETDFHSLILPMDDQFSSFPLQCFIDKVQRDNEQKQLKEQHQISPTNWILPLRLLVAKTTWLLPTCLFVSTSRMSIILILMFLCVFLYFPTRRETESQPGRPVHMKVLLPSFLHSHTWSVSENNCYPLFHIWGHSRKSKGECRQSVKCRYWEKKLNTQTDQDSSLISLISWRGLAALVILLRPVQVTKNKVLKIFNADVGDLWQSWQDWHINQLSAEAVRKYLVRLTAGSEPIFDSKEGYFAHICIFTFEQF